jgi:glutamate N-acetyltransferase/amino-acid N-acetyltransferase
MQWIPGGVTAAQGFRAAGVFAGLKKSRKPDVSLVVCDAPAQVAGVLTRNQVQAAPVTISRERLKQGRAQAVLINSGCANCLTGQPGFQDALTIGRAAAKTLRIPATLVLLGSTGLIGRRLPIIKITRALPRLVRQLSREHHEAAAQAILTTDLHPKEAAVEARIGGGVVRVGGMAKGAGMIAPSMATMLGVLTTDAQVPASLLRSLLRQVTERTFNRISVDGDMSTNDTVFLLASGRSGVSIRPGTPQVAQFALLLEAVAQRLAHLIVQDGEGATKIMEVTVRGARNARAAQAIARQVANSPLVKTMLAGSDPNVGRIAGAVGAAPVRVDVSKLEIRIGGVRLVARGAALPVKPEVMAKLLDRSQVEVLIDVHQGQATASMLTCDFTEEYVRINAGYAT